MRILYVVKGMSLSNGVSSFIMNHVRQMVTDPNFQCDFLVVTDIGSPYYDELKSYGCAIYFMPSYTRHPLQVVPFLKKVFSNKHYDLVHCNVMNSASPILMMAKRYGIKVRIFHSHATQNGDTKWKQARNKLFANLTIKYATTNFACSKLAGDYLFGKDNYYEIPNAIDITKFKFDENTRQKVRDKYHVPSNVKIIMTVGRFTTQKNPMYIVDIIAELKKQDLNFVFWWFGDGELEGDVKKYAEAKQVTDVIKFWGSRIDINRMYMAADVFILPSLFEGLPVVGIEAQISGLPTLLADTVSNETKIGKYTEFLPLDNPACWADEIKKVAKVDHNIVGASVDTSTWNIVKAAQRLKKLYAELIFESGKDL